MVSRALFSLPGDYPAPRAVLTGHDHEVVCVSVCAELGLVISGAKGLCVFILYVCAKDILCFVKLLFFLFLSEFNLG